MKRRQATANGAGNGAGGGDGDQYTRHEMERPRGNNGDYVGNGSARHGRGEIEERVFETSDN